MDLVGLRIPLEIGLGNYMGEYYASLVGDTSGVDEFRRRGLDLSIARVPGRMVDRVDQMLKAWRKNENKAGPGQSSMLPVIFVGLSKDFSPVTPDWAVAVGAPTYVEIPGDEHRRSFKVRVSVNEYRAQIVFAAAEPHTAHSLAMQFHMWANGPRGRRFTHVHQFAGMDHAFPASLENIDMGAVSTDTEQQDVTLLVADMIVRASIPLFQAPKPGEPNDGKPAPAGYPVVVETHIHNRSSGAGYVVSSTADEEGKP